jgi:uncharacterized protein YbjQ (UPF0145 family)
MKLTTSGYYDPLVYEPIGTISSVTNFPFAEFRSEISDILGMFGTKGEKLNEKMTKAQDTVLDSLEDKAYEANADMVVGVSVTPSVLNLGEVGGIIMFSACGTAIRKKETEGGSSKKRSTLRNKKRI